MKKSFMATLALSLVVLMAGGAWAIDITISDGYYNTSDWHKNQENQETEPGTYTGQVWDLEKFTQTGSVLSMQGGYKFDTGFTFNNTLISGGDILIDQAINGAFSSKYGYSGQSTRPITSLSQVTYNSYMGYDFAIKLDFTNKKYTVYALDANSRFNPVTDIVYGNPLSYINNQGKNPVYTSAPGALTFTSFADSEGTHYVVNGIDLSMFLTQPDFFVHYTFSCGNDYMVGQGKVPLPGAVVLLGAGLFRLAAYGRRRRAEI